MSFWENIRDGAWLTRDRLNAYPLILLALMGLAIVGMIALTHDRLGPDNRPLGTDFSQVWVAGQEVLRGDPEEPYDIARHIAEQHREFGPHSAVYGWHYPPYFLAIAAAVANFPYLRALFLWEAATLLLYVIAMAALTWDSRLNQGRLLLAAVAFPGVMVNLGHGQNGFLTAALLGGGFALLDRRPLVAGGLFALLAYKPQFALVLPVALIAGRYWRALGGAIAGGVLMTAASLAAFGVSSWRAFFDSLAFTREKVIEQGATGFEKIQSVFAAIRLMGGDVATAYAFQSISTFGALAALLWLWRSGADRRVKAAATIVATLLSTPYCLDYDMMALAPALALLIAQGVENGFKPYEKSLLAFTFGVPLLARPIAEATSIPLGAITIIFLFASTLRHIQNVIAVREAEASARN